MPEGWTSDARPLDTARIFRALAAEKVRFVLVGGLAAILHRWSGSTFDADIVPAVDTANLNRLGRALHALRAKVWADPARTDLLGGGKPPEADDFGFTAEGLRRAAVWHLMSSAGAIDVAFEIDGVGGYEVLRRGARGRDVFGVDVMVASLQDVITSKRAVARLKDLRVLPELEELLGEDEES